MPENKYSKIALLLALFTLGLFLMALTCTLINQKMNSLSVSTFLVGLPLMIGGLAGVVGFVFSMIGIKEKTSWKKVTALIVNGIVSFLLFLLVLMNLIDIGNSFAK